MIYFAYGTAVVIAVLAATVVPRWMRGRPERIAQARVLAGVLAAAYATLVVGVVAVAQMDVSTVAVWVLAAIALAGAVVYGLGLLQWSGSTAQALRLVGWLLMIGVGAVPSHLTLLLPVAAPLTATLYRVSSLSGTGPDGPPAQGVT
jgi:hypothetical protein